MSQTILLKDGLRIGKKELQLLQSLSLDNLRDLAQALATGLPAVLAPGSALGTALEVTASGTSVSIAPGEALLKDGSRVTVTAPITVAIPDGASKRPVVLRAGTTPYAAGTFSIAAGNRLTLTYSGTSAALAALYAPNDYLRLYSGSSLGTFRIQSVSNQVVVLAEAVPGASDLSGILHAPAGKFFPGYPNVGESTDLVAYTTPEARLEAANYTALENEIILARVDRTGTRVDVTEARTLFQPRGLTEIRNPMIAADAAIAQAKLDLSNDLLNAELVARYLSVYPGNRLVTNNPDFYVLRDGVPRKVLVSDDVVIPAFTSLDATPSTFSIAAGATQAITASVLPQAGAQVTYTMSSANPAIATVAPTSAGAATATVTGVAGGSTFIVIRATAPAVVGSYAAADDTILMPVTVGADGSATSAGVLSTLTVPLTTTLLVNASTTITATTTSPAGVSPTVTWTWELIDKAGDIVTLSATNVANPTITGKTPGTAYILVTAAGAVSGLYPANDRSVVIKVIVNANEGLLDEPGYRVRFERGSDDIITAFFRFGLGGTAAVLSPTTVELTLTGLDAGQSVGSGALAGQAFWDGATPPQRYRITANTAAASNKLTLTVAKTTSGQANPTAGDGIVRSFANSYTFKVLSENGQTELATRETDLTSSPRVREVALTASTAKAGLTYQYLLTAFNNSVTPTTRPNVLTTPKWGGGATGPVVVPPDWVKSTAATDSILFYWSNRLEGYNPAAMNYAIQYSFDGGNTWQSPYGANTWMPVYDDPLALYVNYRLTPPTRGPVTLRVKITDMTNDVRINSATTTPYDGQATNQIAGGGGSDESVAVEYVYPFTTLNGSTSFSENIGTTTSPRYVNVLARYDGVVNTSFTRTVKVVRIDIEFTTALGPATSAVKALVYPTDNPNYQVASNILTASGGNTLSTTNIGADLFLNPNGKITVALESIGTTLPTAGVGRVRVWYTGVSYDGNPY